MTMSEEGGAASSGSDADAAIGKTADAVKGGIDSANDAIDAAASRVTDRVASIRNAVTPALKDGVDRAQDLARQGTTFVSETTLYARVRASEMTDQVLAYTREKPMTALLIAAACGAVLMSVLGPSGRRRR